MALTILALAISTRQHGHVAMRIRQAWETGSESRNVVIFAFPRVVVQYRYEKSEDLEEWYSPGLRIKNHC